MYGVVLILRLFHNKITCFDFVSLSLAAPHRRHQHTEVRWRQLGHSSLSNSSSCSTTSVRCRYHENERQYEAEYEYEYEYGYKCEYESKWIY